MKKSSYLSIDSKIGNVRVIFNPAKFKSAFEQYQQGYQRDIIAMMKRTVIDSHVFGCVDGRKDGFSRPWVISPFDAEDGKDQERADWVKAVLKKLSVGRLFKRIFEARLYGYSVIDFLWEIVDGKQTPVKFKYFDQRFFKYDKDSEELKIDFGKTQKDIPETTLVAEYDETPLMLPVLRDYILKEFGLEAWSAFLETWGEPMLLGYYPPGATEEFKQALQDGINAIAASARGVLPEGSSIDLKETGRSSGDHGAYAERCDKGISITLLGHANAVSDSKGLQVGENVTPYKVRREKAVSDMEFITEEIQKFINILIDRNFGDGRYPSLAFDIRESLSTKDKLAALDQYYEQGGEVNPQDYKEMGVRVSPDQEPLIKKDIIGAL